MSMRLAGSTHSMQRSRSAQGCDIHACQQSACHHAAASALICQAQGLAGLGALPHDAALARLGWSQDMRCSRSELRVSLTHQGDEVAAQNALEHDLHRLSRHELRVCGAGKGEAACVETLRSGVWA